MASDDDEAECINCHRRAAGPGRTWPPGWGCLYGMFACCSRACAEAFAREHGKNPQLDAGDYDDE